MMHSSVTASLRTPTASSSASTLSFTELALLEKVSLEEEDEKQDFVIDSSALLLPSRCSAVAVPSSRRQREGNGRDERKRTSAGRRTNLVDLLSSHPELLFTLHRSPIRSFLLALPLCALL